MNGLDAFTVRLRHARSGGRNKGHWLWCPLFATLLVGACERTATPPPQGHAGAAGGWNVVLISLDTVRADHLGCYGYEVRKTSPNIDRFVARGVQFDRAGAPRAATWPTLTSVLTGLYPRSHGVYTNGFLVGDDVPTLPKALGAAGYETGAFLANMCKGNHLGWDEFYCDYGQDKEVNRRALEWLDDRDGARPYLLWTHYLAAHGPYAKGVRRVRDDLDPEYVGPVKPNQHSLDQIMAQRIDLEPSDLYRLNLLYDSAIMEADHLVGQLVDRVAREENGRKTLFVFLSDHGEELWEHNAYLYHACSMFETALHVPLAFVATGLIDGPARVAAPVELIDVPATILDLIGVDMSSELQGVSLVPLLEGREAGVPERPVFSEYGRSKLHTVIAQGWKLIDNPDGLRPACVPGAREFSYPVETVALFDLINDPGERQNLAVEYPERVQELRGLIRDRFAVIPDRRVPQNVGDNLRRHLEAIGYVEQ